MEKTAKRSLRKTLNIKDSSPEIFEKYLCKITKRLSEKKNKVFLLAHSYDAVRIGTVEEKRLNVRGTLDPQYLQELRLFSEQWELHIWKAGGIFYNRLRIDEPDEKNHEENPLCESFYHLDQKPLMWGTTIRDHQDGWTLLTEERGTNIWVPFNISKEEERTKLPLRYKVRNYYNFDDNGIIQFQDARLCTFLDMKKQPLS